MKFLFTNRNIDSSLAKDFENLSLKEIGNYSLLINDTSTILETENLFSVTNGYLRDYSIENITLQKKSAAEHVFENWPVEDHITGSFSTFIFNKEAQEIVLSTDHCNIYPIYHLKCGNDFYFSNSIILLGRISKVAIDKAGVFQRAIGPNFSNIGSRTILKDCKRLLPGEWIKFNQHGEIIDKKYDNTLYQNIGSPSFDKNDLKSYWDSYQNEVSLCSQDFSEVNIALSGGIDSRVALGAIPGNLEIKAKTFGHPDNYESKVASKLAKLKGATHECYYDPGQYFPKKKTLMDYSKNTEAVKLNSWLEILEKHNSIKKLPLILGELCEGLPARNIKTFSSRKFRNRNFIKYYIKKDPFNFTPATIKNFNEWKVSKMKKILSWHDDNWFKKLELENFKNEIIESTIKDTNEIFERIEVHNLPFSELFDELFSWYTFTRMELSRQVNICNEKFYAFSPGMSLQMLKKTSNLHPNNRLYYRFANGLFRTIPELKIFNKVPTSQIPIIPQNSPNILKIPVWGIRSKIDEFLVRRLMKSKNPNSRYRLLKSINWVQVYQQPGMLTNIKEYYSNNQIGELYSGTFYKVAENRMHLINWPFANMDIISGATLNAELDLIKNLPE